MTEAEKDPARRAMLIGWEAGWDAHKAYAKTLPPSPDEQPAKPTEVPVAPWMTGDDPTEPRTYRGKRRRDDAPSDEAMRALAHEDADRVVDRFLTARDEFNSLGGVVAETPDLPSWPASVDGRCHALAGSIRCDKPALHDGDHHWGDAPEDAVEELATALIHTREYVGEDRLPALPGWSWYDALAKYAPDQLQQTLDGYATQVTERTAAATAAASDPWAEGTGDGYSVPHLRRALEFLRDLGQTTSQVPGGHLMRLCNDALTGRKPRP